MGHHAGWLTAASLLHENSKVIIQFLSICRKLTLIRKTLSPKWKQLYRQLLILLFVSLKEFNDRNGTFICEYASNVGIDTFGHKMLPGSGKYLENLIKDNLGVKVRSVELNVCQRCSFSMPFGDRYFMKQSPPELLP